MNTYAGSKFTGLGTVISSDGIVVRKQRDRWVDPGTLRIVGPGKRIGRTRILARDIAHDLVFLDPAARIPVMNGATSRPLATALGWLPRPVPPLGPACEVAGLQCHHARTGKRLAA